MRFDARAWLVWITAIAILSMFVRSPLYSLLLLALSLLAIRLHARNTTLLQPVFLRLSITILVFSAVYHALFIHVGDHVLFELPNWPLIGGVVTIEAVIDGFRNGLVLVSLLAAFMALNAIVPSKEIIRLVPPAFHDLSVVILIAVTYIPETRRHWQRIQEAQAIRGHRVRGLRDWRPLMVPLLVGGLERAMNLSEAMVSRGTVQIERMNTGRSYTLLLISGVASSLLGWIGTLVWGIPGYILIAVGVTLVGVVIARSGKLQRRTRYARSSWSMHDTLFVFTSLASLTLVFVIWPLLGSHQLSYNPYPSIQLPQFHPIFGMAALLLAYPILSSLLVTDGASSDNHNRIASESSKEFGQVS